MKVIYLYFLTIPVFFGIDMIWLYAETLKRWRQRFIAAKDDLTRMRFNRTLQHKWIYSFSICEAQFALRVLNNLQLVLTREGNRSLIK